MTTARCKIVDLTLTPYYHCISKCVRGAHLCNDRFGRRKQWLEDRLELLAANFAIGVAGFAVMDNHLHLLVRLDPDAVNAWSDRETIRRWISVYPPRGIDFDDDANVEFWIDHYLEDKRNVAKYRERLANLGWFMKSLKEPLARLANREDGCEGTFWQGRYKSIAILDDEALLTTCAYIDLNPVAAGIARTPERSKHTSIRQRVNHFQRQGKMELLRFAKQGSIKASRAIGNVEQNHWLIPFDDRRSDTNAKPSTSREGMLDRFTLGNYMILVDYVGRIFRSGKATIKENIKPVFERLSTKVLDWTDRLREMLDSKKLRGRCFAGSIENLDPTKKKVFAHALNLSPQGVG